MHKSLYLIINRFIVLLLSLIAVAGQSQPSAITLFASDTAIHVFLTTDMRSLMKSKYSEENQPAKLQIVRIPGDTTSYDVEIRCRGNIRKETCYYPSIRMKLPKKDFTYNKLKWVNVCNGVSDEENLFQEYLAYQMYNLVTDKSFQTYLVRIHYRDSSGKEKPFNSYAFVIQNADELAEKFWGRVHEPVILKESVLNREQLAIFSFFQYMIGNTDWAFGNRHNVEVFTHPETNTVIPVAYDFDYSGFVNTKYATPHESMPITHVTIRHNKSVCLDTELCEQTRHLFLEKKEAILSTCREFQLIDSRSRAKAVDYLEGFFKILEDRKDTERIFIKDCRQMQ
ncbi:MAG TPA: hypothetical protein VI603_13290 [Saprospiraceae bacterium]|nr:hypothetical protein [Saprospiraceae bacterium]